MLEHDQRYPHRCNRQLDRYLSDPATTKPYDGAIGAYVSNLRDEMQLAREILFIPHALQASAASFAPRQCELDMDPAHLALAVNAEREAQIGAACLVQAKLDAITEAQQQTG